MPDGAALIRPTEFVQHIELALLCRLDKAFTPHPARTKRTLPVRPPRSQEDHPKGVYLRHKDAFKMHLILSMMR